MAERREFLGGGCCCVNKGCMFLDGFGIACMSIKARPASVTHWHTKCTTTLPGLALYIFYMNFFSDHLSYTSSNMVPIPGLKLRHKTHACHGTFYGTFYGTFCIMFYCLIWFYTICYWNHTFLISVYNKPVLPLTGAKHLQIVTSLLFN